MALKGNLKEFNITNILQMISLEKKAGALTVSLGEKTIRINFSEGKVSSVDRGVKTDENRIKNALIKNNFIKENDWNKAYAERQKSLKPLYQILKKYVKKEILVSLANNQVKDGLFEILRWGDGEYEFIPRKIHFDAELVSPLDVEFLLMEGCRIGDELSLIKEGLPRDNESITKNIFDYDKSYFTDLNKTDKALLELEIIKKRGIELDEAERKIFLIMDEYTTIEDIASYSMSGEFETYKIISKFLSLKLIKPCKKRKLKKMKAQLKSEITLYRRMDRFLCLTSLLVLFIVNAWGIFNSYQKFHTEISTHKSGVDVIKKDTAGIELNIITASINDFYRLTGRYPDYIEEIAKNGLLQEKYLYDPWRRRYRYSFYKEDNTFALFSSGEDEKDDKDNLFSRPVL